ncbi:MAG: hypothetical protein KDA20_06420 [Phycisphaerales bacterium]|nr:hypothetical protein [Phycisphaerales bacterium]
MGYDLALISMEYSDAELRAFVAEYQSGWQRHPQGFRDYDRWVTASRSLADAITTVAPDLTQLGHGGDDSWGFPATASYRAPFVLRHSLGITIHCFEDAAVVKCALHTNDPLFASESWHQGKVPTAISPGPIAQLCWRVRTNMEPRGSWRLWDIAGDEFVGSQAGLVTTLSKARK